MLFTDLLDIGTRARTFRIRNAGPASFRGSIYAVFHRFGHGGIILLGFTRFTFRGMFLGELLGLIRSHIKRDCRDVIIDILAQFFGFLLARRLLHRGNYRNAVLQTHFHDGMGIFLGTAVKTGALDEIGELSLASQVKLLRVLQDQTYEVLGDSQTRRTDVRVVCATNADLRAMVEEKTFREDLFYRINIINLHLPPLRDRREDIPLLVNHFLRMACEANGLPLVTVSTEAIGYLQTLPFPGNIRELKNLVERALLMKDPAASQLTAADFALLSKDIPSGKPMGTEPATLDSMERNAIAACIAKHNGNLSLVAKELGISRGALYRKIEKHGL